jgi:hypothetical protein
MLISVSLHCEGDRTAGTVTLALTVLLWSVALAKRNDHSRDEVMRLRVVAGWASTAN